jgi:hypothetical protein
MWKVGLQLISVILILIVIPVALVSMIHVSLSVLSQAYSSQSSNGWTFGEISSKD